MDAMERQIEALTARMIRNAPARAGEVEAFEARAGIALPEEYRRFLSMSNGAEGPVDVGCGMSVATATLREVRCGGYAMLWPVGRLEAINEAYCVNEFAPGVLLFGSSGGGEAYVFELDRGMSIARIPFVPLDRGYAEPMRGSFVEFLRALGNPSGTIDVSDKGAARSRPLDVEVFDIHPIMLGGDPLDPANKTVLSREKHVEAVVWWNRKIREIRGV